jgi:hypothetical protein
LSLDRAMKALAGTVTDRVARMEFLTNPEFFSRITGIDPYKNTMDAWLRALDVLDIDATIVGRIPSLQRDDEHRVADDHHVSAQWGLRETEWLSKPYYTSVDEILAFDPRNHDTSSAQEKTDRYSANYQQTQRLFGSTTLYVPGHYQLILHYMPFYCDWTTFFETVALEPDRCRFLYDRCEAYSIEVFSALASTDAPLIIAHEDLCGTRGPLFSPEMLRREVFPRFARIFEPVKRAGKRIIYASDGLIDEIAPDLLAAGADGLLVERGNDLERLIGLVGQEGLLIGGGDTVTVTNGNRNEIRDEVRKRMKIAKSLPGFFFCLDGEAPQNVPVENLEAYFEAVDEFGGIH